MLPDWWIKNFGEKPYAITDCVEAMKKVPDKAVDLVLTDPPYGINVDYGEYQDTKENLLKLIEKFIPEVLRIAKFTMIFPGYNNLFNYPKPDHVMVWEYFPGDSYCSYGFNSWQPILIYGPDPYLKHGKGARHDLTRCRQHVESIHPCVKPIDLIKWCVERGTVNEGAVVLDPFLGRGTTLAACKISGRIGLGFESNPEYEILIKKFLDETLIPAKPLSRIADFE